MIRSAKNDVYLRFTGWLLVIAGQLKTVQLGSTADQFVVSGVYS